MAGNLSCYNPIISSVWSGLEGWNYVSNIVLFKEDTAEKNLREKIDARWDIIAQSAINDNSLSSTLALSNIRVT